MSDAGDVRHDAVLLDPQPEDKDPTLWPAQVLAHIQAILDRSRRVAGAAVLDTFNRPERQLSALEFAQFWNATRMKAMATVSAEGTPHIAPVHAELVQGRLRTTIFEKAARRVDLSRNPRVAFTCWGPHGAAAILNGLAREVPGSLRETRTGASGGPRRTVTLEIEITRIYVMRGREPGPTPDTSTTQATPT